MKFCLLIFSVLLVAFMPARAANKKVLLFAVLNQDTPVDLADGAKWMMDKGDAFPVVMFKDSQTKLVLQLAGTTFIVPAANARILQEDEVTEDVLAVYRRNVTSYIDGKTRKWLSAAQGSDADSGKASAPK